MPSTGKRRDIRFGRTGDMVRFFLGHRGGQRALTERNQCGVQFAARREVETARGARAHAARTERRSNSTREAKGPGSARSHDGPQDDARRVSRARDRMYRAPCRRAARTEQSTRAKLPAQPRRKIAVARACRALIASCETNAAPQLDSTCEQHVSRFPGQIRAKHVGSSPPCQTLSKPLMALCWTP